MDTDFLMTTKLFENIKADDFLKLFSCIRPRQESFTKGQLIYCAGSQVEEIGLIKSGGVNIVFNSYWGSRQIFAHLGPGQVFGENYAALNNMSLAADIEASEDSQVIFFRLQSLLTSCSRSCVFHQQLIFNLFKTSAQKNLQLTRRMIHTSSKSLRDRLTSYLSEQAKINNSPKFSIPFNRQGLADYLGVDRSAMSNQLSKMKKDGLIDYKKNHFVLKDLEEGY
ncbi:MAG: Crp/Fnr family transcriptional regulator [Bacillota bacterium]|nr:Crp/Fnr family transcriptional regulator [Bacillota bacterium]